MLSVVNNPNENRYGQMSDFFLNYRKDPDKETTLMEHFLQHTNSIPFALLNRGMVKCMKTHSSFFPTLQQLKDCVTEESPVVKYKPTPCFKCDATGFVYSPFFYDEENDFDLEIVGWNHVPRVKALKSGEIVPAPGHYHFKMVGRCDCANGQRLASRGLPIVQPHRYILAAAKENGWDCTFQCQMVYQHFKYKRLGKEVPKLSPMYKLIIDKMLNKGDELYE